ncbi:hypothetical protein B0O80DRAFT_493869 [Mortierella sp. GBAus27b]|nr:hypothetical protein BGX31_005663 [Mortierella sp. GBA43]KAI8361285.1 hypothetical protein B0O80DRAFT_493869 [Mortierella sp. GBAus27b]
MASIIVKCNSQEELSDLIRGSMKVIVLYYSYKMPWGKNAEQKMNLCASELEKGNITSIPFVLVDYENFTEDGFKVENYPQSIRYSAYLDGEETQSTGNSAELEGLVTSLL